MEYKLHLTTKDGELIETFEINTDEFNWDNQAFMGMEIIERIKTDLKHNRRDKKWSK